MPNRRKRILLVSALVIAVGLVLMLRPRSEPKYQGRYLSDWMEEIAGPDPPPDKVKVVNQVVENIGTNGLPLFLEWLSIETPPWKRSLRNKLPHNVAQNEYVADWLGKKDIAHIVLGAHGICLLGTNASGAIPELQSLLRSRTNRVILGFTINALTAIGLESVPGLSVAFSDPKQPLRTRILWSLRRLAFKGHTNECMPIIVAAVEDPDAKVRLQATNLLQVTSTEELSEFVFR